MAINIPYASGGGGKVFLPLAETLIHNQAIALIDASGSLLASNASGFYTVIENPDSLEKGWQADTLVVAGNTTEQTILDESGQGGVLTHILSPRLTTVGTHTIRVTLDNEVYTFVSSTDPSNAQRFCLGYFGHFSPGTSTSFPGGNNARSFGDLAEIGTRQYWLPNPVEALQFGIGMPFENSIKVTYQSSVNPQTGNETGKCSVLRTATIPKGIF